MVGSMYIYQPALKARLLDGLLLRLDGRGLIGRCGYNTTVTTGGDSWPRMRIALGADSITEGLS